MPLACSANPLVNTIHNSLNVVRAAFPGRDSRNAREIIPTNLPHSRRRIGGFSLLVLV
jgi:hypothetical protein